MVGICEVVREAYPDSTALDSKSPKFDPKSHPEKPIWFMVDVKLVGLRLNTALASLRNAHMALSIRHIRPRHGSDSRLKEFTQKVGNAKALYMSCEALQDQRFGQLRQSCAPASRHGTPDASLIDNC